MTSIAEASAGSRREPRPKLPIIHPLFVRITHWINALAMVVMISSGWAIHNAYPTLPFWFPTWMTLGGSLSGGLQWHFAAMWLLILNGLFYLGYGLVSGRFRRKLLPITPTAVFRDLQAALAGRLDHADLSVYNAVQRLLYAGVILIGILIVLTGLSIWKPVQLRVLAELFGDFDVARLIHFAAMSGIVLFILIHIAMALLVPQSLRAMLRGR